MSSDSVNTNGKSGAGTAAVAVATPPAPLAAQSSFVQSAAALTPDLSTAMQIESGSGFSAAQLTAGSAFNTNGGATVTARASSAAKPPPAPPAATIPAKRRRPSARAATDSVDVRHRPLSPFSVLELLTNGFDGSLVLHDAALAGFRVPLLEAVDSARIKQALQYSTTGETPPSVLHMYSNSRGQLGPLSGSSSDSASDDERAAAAARAKPKRKHKRLAIATQPGAANTSQAQTIQAGDTTAGGKATDQSSATAAATAAAATAKRKAPSSSSAAPSKKSGKPRKDGQLSSTVASGAAAAPGAPSSTDDAAANAAAVSAHLTAPSSSHPSKSPPVHRSIQSMHGAAGTARGASPAPSAAAKKHGASVALKTDDNWTSRDEAKQSASRAASATPVPSANVSGFPFTHVSAHSIRFRKADLAPADLNKWRKLRALQRRREQLMQQEEDEANDDEKSELTTKMSGGGRSAAAAAAKSSEVDADGDSAMSSNSSEQAAAAGPIPSVTSEAQRLRREQEQAAAAEAAEAAAREAAIQAATVGMSARQARYLYTNLTPTNIIPEGRRRKAKEAALGLTTTKPD